MVGGLLVRRSENFAAAEGVVRQIQVCIDNQHSSPEQKASREILCIQRRKMPHDAAAQGTEVIPAFEHADDFSAAVEVGDLDEFMRHLLEGILGQVDLGQWVVPVGVEAGGDQEDFRPELIEPERNTRVV